MIIQKQKIQAGERVWTLDWQKSGQLLATAGSSKQVSIWHYHPQSSTLTKSSTIYTQHAKTIRSVKFSWQGDKIACTSFDATVTVWIFSQESQEYELLSTLEGHVSEVKAVSWRNDDAKIATCSRDKNIWVWEFDNTCYDYTCDAVLEGHTEDVKNVQWLEGMPNSLVSCSYDNTLRIWEGEDDDYTCKQVLQGHNSIVWNVAQANHSRTLFSVGEDCRVIRWDLGNDQKYELKYILVGLHSFPIYACCILDSKWLLTGSGDNKTSLILWDDYQASKQPQQATPLACMHSLSDVNFLQACPKDPSTFASCSDDETIRICKFQ